MDRSATKRGSVSPEIKHEARNTGVKPIEIVIFRTPEGRFKYKFPNDQIFKPWSFYPATHKKDFELGYILNTIKIRALLDWENEDNAASHFL